MSDTAQEEMKKQGNGIYAQSNARRELYMCA